MAQPAEVAGLELAVGDDPVRAWARLPAGTQEAYVRFRRGDGGRRGNRGGDLPLAAVQRLARRGRIVVDAAPRDAGDVLDLAVAGAAVVVAWLADGGDVRAMAGAMGDGLMVGCTAADAAAAVAIARELDVPLLVASGEAPAESYGYRIGGEGAALRLVPFGQWPDAAPAQEGEAAEAEEGAGDGEGDEKGEMEGDAADDGSEEP